MFTGDVIDAHQAKTLGLVGRTVPNEALLPTAMEIAHKIARNPPLAVQALKAGLRRTTEPDWQDTGRWAIEQITRLRGTDDSKEGVAAFLEKREPVYRGH